MNAVYQIDIERRETDQSQRPKDREGEDTLRDAGAQTDEDVHLFGRVMRRMHSPKDIYRVTPAVHPVREEIHQDQENEEGVNIQPDRVKAEIAPQVAVDQIDTRRYQHVHRLVPECCAEIRDRFLK